jgi:5-methylcytosine-specific restriction endonuclease McrA
MAITARSITLAQRFGVWKAGKGRCFWCREPVLFRDCQVDHVIPLNAVSTNNAAVSVRSLYDLPDDFDFDHFGNCVSAHSGCNQRKSFTLLDPTPAFALHLAEARALASEAADPPPLKWSDLRYVFDIKEDCNGKEAIQA